MFNPNFKPTPDLDANIVMMEQTLSTLEWNTPEYNDCLTRLERLHKLKAKMPRRPAIDPNVVITAITSLGGIATIVGYERMQIITSKAMALLVKPRLP